ncbi:MAG: ribonuclease [Micavibrio sp.]|nr:ribonuclease [Micavibrio sp.]HCK33075.1 ribonuclease [Rhodospirillaceae bacterium]
MSKKMLIDAMHPEETRVVVMDENRLEDFDFESKVKTSYKSNIYLAKVTRVEPSLQAAFVNYGGNRHGFLPFSEIHPDYYRIPIEDRERLMKEQEEIAKKIAAAQEAKGGDSDDLEESEIDALIEEVNAEINNEDSDQEDESKKAEVDSDDAEENNDGDDKKKKKSRRGRRKKKDTENALEDEKSESDDQADADSNEDDGETSEDEKSESDDDSQDDAEGNDENKNKNNNNKKRNNRGRYRGRRGRRGGKKYAAAKSKSQSVDTVGGDDFFDDPVALLWKKMRRTYKIQEVIKRGQVMLVQCQKEERGNKGAAMTTYITLPGRYGVLMPNSPRGGGISRKIGWADRKKLKDVLKEVTIPSGMSVILRTAAVGRSKTEIKRDLEYLYKLWDSIRELTLNSNAPALVYEEGQLVKRAIRDIYTREVDEVLVAGEESFKDTKNFMKMMIPSHAKKVKEYKDKDRPLFVKYQAEHQIDEIYDQEVTLKSGGYLVIHPTEALISIDVNSGKSTKERNIEGTALRTNLEAAEEVARQLRLRDLGGLVVIDFIDMEDYRNNREVERRLTDALSSDRARVQVGRISNFGLLELSRQRLRPSLTETHFETCRHCQGAGTVRTKETAALRVLRMIEEEGIKNRTSELTANVPSEVGLYIMNVKRDALTVIENRYDFKVFIHIDEELTISEVNFERIKSKAKKNRRGKKDQQDDKTADEIVADEMQTAAESESEESSSKPSDKDDTQNDDKGAEKAKKKPRRGRKKKPEAKDKNQDKDQDPKESKDSKEQKSDSDESKKDEKAEKPKKKTLSKRSPKAKPSNDDAPKETGKESDDKPVLADKGYEVVNEAPKKKKKGWWNNLLDS